MILDGYLYTALELSNQVAKHRLSALPSEPELITVASTMFNPPSSPTDMIVAEILLPKPNSSFPTPYLYVSNRNDPSPEGDTVAIFSLANPSKLELVNEVRTGLNHVRGMGIGGPDDKYVVVGGLISGGVKVFERMDGGKGLKAVAAVKEVDAPSGFLWM
jgi:6-phosphogluconolactonase (cycloisomerase 2 family)